MESLSLLSLSLSRHHHRLFSLSFSSCRSCRWFTTPTTALLVCFACHRVDVTRGLLLSRGGVTTATTTAHMALVWSVCACVCR